MREEHTAAFSSTDVGKTVSIDGDMVTVDGQVRRIKPWGDTKHHDVTGKIKGVVAKVKGKVRLEDGDEFENPIKEWDISHWAAFGVYGLAPAEVMVEGERPAQL